MTESTIQVCAIIASNLVIMLTIFGINISLHNEIKQDIRAMQEESKRFHGQLERQDAEFKAKMEKQDAEFKSHIIYMHAEKK